MTSTGKCVLVYFLLLRAPQTCCEYRRVDAQLNLWAEDEDQTDIVWLTSSGFLEPTTLLRGEVSEVAITSKKMKSLKGVYDTDGLVVTQAQACLRTFRLTGSLSLWPLVVFSDGWGGWVCTLPATP